MSENGLTSLPKEIGKLKNLRVLECEGNKLEALPEELSKLQNLEILRLGRNQIKDVSALKKMNNLVTLVVDNNRLRTLDDFDLGSKKEEEKRRTRKEKREKRRKRKEEKKKEFKRKLVKNKRKKREK